MGGWTDQLRELRDALELTRQEVAEQARVSAESLRAYETGRRRPGREALIAVLDVLQPDPVRRRSILVGAGFAPDRDHVGRLVAGDLTLAEAEEEVASWPWPGHLSSEYWEVLVANQAMQDVWGICLAEEARDPLGMNLLVALSERRFADRLDNWDMVVSLIVAALKGGYDDLFSGERTHPYFSSVVERFLAGDTPYVQRFARIWADTDPNVQRPRFSFPIVWRSDAGELRFRVAVNPAGSTEYMTFGEWIPVDAATWGRLAQLAGSSRKARSTASVRSG